MFSTCIFCHASLGANAVVEHFPVGRRLAFDPEKGRLWVVCRRCQRWNLSPLEERWEAIEECERLVRDTRLRVSTEHVGLAHLREGLELVRVGRPQRPELAAWRYGDQLGRRRRASLIQAGLGLGLLGVVVAGGAAVGVGVGGFGWMLVQAGTRIVNGSPEKVVARIPDPEGSALMAVRRKHLPHVQLAPDEGGGWALGVPRGRKRLIYLQPGLAMVLIFVGAKLAASHLIHIPVVVSLFIVSLLLDGSIVASLRKQAADHRAADIA